MINRLMTPGHTQKYCMTIRSIAWYPDPAPIPKGFGRYTPRRQCVVTGVRDIFGTIFKTVLNLFCVYRLGLTLLWL